MIQSNKRIFGSGFEFFNLILPLIFIILLFCEYFFRHRTLGSLSRFEISILANIVFLNITHNAFTLIMLTSNKKMETWIEAQGGPKVFWPTQLMVMTALTVFFSAILFFSYQSYLLFTLLVLIGFNFAAHHALSQTFGLSLIYSDGPVKGERVLFTLFLLSNLFIGTFTLLYYHKKIFIPADKFHQLVRIAMLFMLLNGLGLIILARKNLHKVVFNLRYLLWPFTLISPLAIFSTLVIHGVEYALVTHKVIRKDSLRRPVLAFILVFIVIAFAIVRLESLESVKNHLELPLWLIVVTGTSLAFSFYHYYLDRKLFKMRHKINRETIGQMLFEDEVRRG